MSDFASVVAGNPEIIQACGLGSSVTSTLPVFVSVDCNEVTQLITYSVTDVCGQIQSCDQIITVSDNNNAIDENFICTNSSYFAMLDCDNGGRLDMEECQLGLNPENPCDDVYFELSGVDVACFLSLIHI